MLNKTIDRKSLVTRHNPILREIAADSPLTVGNGEFAFTADITGLQTLADAYSVFPLCTMSTWGWHTQPDNGRYYTFDDLKLTEYETSGRKFRYASLPQPGNDITYNWLRHNPHRLNLARIGLLFDREPVKPQMLGNIHQELDLYTGILHSTFTIHGSLVRVETACTQKADVLGFSIEADPAMSGRLSVGISFPYGSHNKDASDWNSPDKHTTELGVRNEALGVRLGRTLDEDCYSVVLFGVKTINQIDEHSFEFRDNTFTVAFAQNAEEISKAWTFMDVLQDSCEGWQAFWTCGGAADFSLSKDPRAMELERRAVLSQYLTAVQCSGSMPPQETGLSCNSWYGKFHLEMHILHAGWFPLWGHGKLLERSLPWYKKILSAAQENAARNGYTGARWPKMTAPSGIDSPSWIATLLIWQQPHLIYMLDLLCSAKSDNERTAFLHSGRELITETARFMCSFAQFNKQTGRYDLPPPLIPVQEEHEPGNALNPAFELAYWQFALETAAGMVTDIGTGGGYDRDLSAFQDISRNMAELPVHNGLYIAHQNCPDTFTAFNRDHPSMLYAYGFIPNDSIDKEIMLRTVNKVLDCWDKESLWGWDYALIAMTLMRLGKFEQAMDVLLAEEAKNYCAISGNYFQKGRDDLPLYLPGNGSLLFALAMLLAGYGGSGSCLPENGQWEAVVEGILPLPR